MYTYLVVTIANKRRIKAVKEVPNEKRSISKKKSQPFLTSNSAHPPNLNADQQIYLTNEGNRLKLQMTTDDSQVWSSVASLFVRVRENLGEEEARVLHIEFKTVL